MQFSIITISYNSEKHIQKTIESVLKQKFCDFEYIIIDGASTDGTVDKICKYLSDDKIIFISEEDKGISDAFNKGVARSSGEYCLFLNSGDYFVDENVLKEVERYILLSEEDIISGSVISAGFDRFPKNEAHGVELWNEGMIHHQATFIKSTVFKKIGLYNEYFKIRMDYDFFMRCLKNNCSFKYIPIDIAYYDVTGVSATNNFRFEKEGLAVRFLYNDLIKKEDLNIVASLLHYKDLSCGKKEFEICSSDQEKKQKLLYASEVIIYGAGTAGIRLRELIKERLSANIYLCDNFRKGKYIDELNCKIYDPEEVISLHREIPIIISMQNKKVIFEIMKGLIEKKEILYIYDEQLKEIY